MFESGFLPFWLRQLWFTAAITKVYVRQARKKWWKPATAQKDPFISICLPICLPTRLPIRPSNNKALIYGNHSAL